MNEKNTKEIGYDKSDSPSIFAGMHYYKYLVDTMRGCQMAILRNDFELWFRLLCNYYNSTFMFMSKKDAEEILIKMNNVEKHVYSVSDAVQGRSINLVQASRSLHFQVRELERELYRATKNLLLRMGSSGDYSTEDTLEAMF
jgi:hypothetical protein